MNSSQASPPPIVWWMIWASILAAFFVFYGVLNTAAQQTNLPPSLGLIAVGPLAASAVIRFLILPRLANRRFQFVFFIIGIALAEAGGFLGIFLGGDQRSIFAAAAIVLMILHVPAFLSAGKP
jgi:hypothetical protein